MVVRSSYLHNGISYSGKTTSLYWIRPLLCKSCNATVPYLTMQHFLTEICTHAHFLYKMLHCGISVWCIVDFVRWDYCMLFNRAWQPSRHYCPGQWEIALKQQDFQSQVVRKSSRKSPDIIPFSVIFGLTHWGGVKMDAILQTTFSNAFSWVKFVFPRVKLSICQHWFR